MIDLRSDTLTKPTESMRIAMFRAAVGDDGRWNEAGRGEDPTVNHLEDLAAEISGMEAALFCNSGTMANILALAARCKRGDAVAISPFNHIYYSEKSPFMAEYFGLNPILYEVDAKGVPDPCHLQSIFKERPIRLLCLENSNNFMGGTCMSVQQTREICALAKEYRIPVHLDGARIFNAAIHFGVPVKELIEPADSVMFCLSKGLGAPMGSLLCGSAKLIGRARTIRKWLGGGMRQAGIVASAGIVALQEETARLEEDHRLAKRLVRQLQGIPKIKADPALVETNMVTVDVSASGYSAGKFERELAKRGLRVKRISDRAVRMVTYRGIRSEDIDAAAKIFAGYCTKL